MPAAYDQILVKGTPRYRKDKQFIKAENVPEAVREVLTTTNIVDENGTVIVEEKGDFAPVDESQDTTPAEEQPATPAQEAPAPPVNAPLAPAPNMAVPSTPDGVPGTPAALPSVPEGNAQELADTPVKKFQSKTPQSDPGMGFKRVSGKTVDIFDETTPHTHVKYVGGHQVPLNRENFLTKTDSEIEAKLKELGFEIVDYNQYETEEEAKAGKKRATSNDGNDDGLEDDVI